MANFKTHITVSSISSGVLAACVLETGAIGHQEMVVYSVLGAVGGTLPDLDLDQSTPSQLLFTVVSAMLAFAVMFTRGVHLSILEMLLIWAAVYCTVRYGLFRIVQKMTEHRGLFHSLAAAVCCGILTAVFGSRILGATPLQSWLGGVFTSFGYLVHLALDELYSVDLLGCRIKKSFGTALKPLSLAEPFWSAVLIAATIGAFLLTPPADTLLRLLGDGNTWAAIGGKLLPQGAWFSSR